MARAKKPAVSERRLPERFDPVGYLQPWEKQPKEPARAFEAFKHFRDSKHMRSLSHTCQEFFGSSVDFTDFALGNAAYQQLLRWSREYFWDLRVLEFDRYVDRVEVAKNLQDLRDMKTRHVGFGKVIASKAFAAFAGKTSDELAQLSAVTLAKLIDHGIALERQAHELPDVTHQHQVSGNIDGNVSVNVSGSVAHQHGHVHLTAEDIAERLNGLARKVDPTGIVDTSKFKYGTGNQVQAAIPPPKKLKEPKKAKGRKL